MLRRKVPATDLALSELGLGCYAWSGAYGPVDTGSFDRLVACARALGVSFYDTAAAYGEAEELLGRAVAGFRPELTIATKPGFGPGGRPDNSAAQLRRQCELSLRRLRTDYIDLYHLHYDDPTTPVEETAAALDLLVQQGKIRYWGVGHLPAERVQAFARLGGMRTTLMELHPAARARALAPGPGPQPAVIAFSVTGRGLFTGGIGPGHVFDPGDIRRLDPLFQREQLASGLRIAGYLRELGSRLHRTPAQLSIAWVLGQPGVVGALTGTTSQAHLTENATGTGWSWPADELERFEAFLSAEEEWVQRQRLAGLERLLSSPLAGDPDQAFRDLVYIMESLVALERVAESAVMPVFLALRKERSGNALARAHAHLRELYSAATPAR